MTFTHIACPLCGSKKNYSILYPKNFNISDINKTIFSARRIPDKIHYQFVKCNACGLVRSTPTIRTNHLNSLYQNSRLTYDEEIKNLTRTYVDTLKPILNKLAYTANILEIGCGNGFILKALRDFGYTNIFGIEPSSDAIAKAHVSIKENLRQSILKSGIFKPRTFDFIFFFQTLDHVPNPNVFLQECYRLLKHDGYILTFNHDVDSFSAKILREKHPIYDIEHTFLYNPKTISKIFNKNGFHVDTVYSPSNYVSLRHIIWLFPIPKRIKKILLSLKLKLFTVAVNIQLGNLCLVGHKV